ncbi:unnamed protein product [Coregonus sp. 'balchen']|nr:unnamed protein product [Coregonus sp. 'balchen']
MTGRRVSTSPCCWRCSFRNLAGFFKTNVNDFLKLCSYSGDVCEETERNIMDITFQRQMEDEKSHCYFRLVHNLLCQYIGSETTWIKKYPTSRYIPTLLHDVGLVVSRCRLLGEEINLMKKWGCSEAGHPGHQLCGHTERPEDIVSSVTPAKNHLIKIVKRIRQE